MHQPLLPGPGLPGAQPRAPGELSAWIIVALPVVLGVFMFVVTPTYFRPLFQNAVGWLILGLIVVLEVAAFAAVSWLNGRFGARPMAHRLGLMVIMVGLIFPTLWLLLLGPAVVVVMKARGG